MPPRKILVGTKRDSDWVSFLQEYLEDLPADLQFVHERSQISHSFSSSPIDLAFLCPEYFSLGLSQKIKAYQKSYPNFRLFYVDALRKEGDRDMEIAGVFQQPPELMHFQRQIVAGLPLPVCLKVLVIDDESQMAELLQDYLGGRQNPQFEIHYASEGELGLKKIDQLNPHIVILDIKMPKMSGREVYAEMHKKDCHIPVIFFFDAISGEDLAGIRQIGKPVVIEKGSKQSSVSDMASMIKQCVYFS